MNRYATMLICTCLALLAALPAQAQDPVEVTVRELNTIPQENIDALNDLGTAITAEDLEELARSQYAGQRVEFTGVVLAEPRNSGLASVTDDGVPGRVHFFVRDVAAETEGPEGMDVQIVDGGYEEKGLLGLFKGDVVRVVGNVEYFGTNLQVTPETVEFLGDYESQGLSASILDPVAVSTADINKNVGEAQVQANWDTFSSMNQQYVTIAGATVWRSVSRTDDRPSWAITSDGAQTIVQNDDISLCFRNDREDYPTTFNEDCLGDTFEGPPPGATVNVTGFALIRSDFDPFLIGAPAVAMMTIVPWEIGDVEVTAEPSITNVAFQGLEGVPGEGPIAITVDVEGDLGAVTNAALIYETSATTEADTLALTDQGDGTFTAEIPEQDDRTFVRYNAEITDNTGTTFTAPAPVITRVLFGGITSISDIQEPWSEMGTDASPFADQTFDMDITATVQTSPGTSGMIAIQDDAELNPWTGIFIASSEALTADLENGDVINITNATIEEDFGLTRLNDVTYTTVESGDPLGYVVLTTDVLQDGDIAEGYEGMAIRFEDVIVTSTNPDAPSGPFGEWGLSSDGSEENQVRADDQSSAISSSFAAGLNRWERYDFQQGIWSYSFSNYKLWPETVENDIGTVTNVSSEDETPHSFALGQNYPNPFNPATTIEFSVPQSTRVTLELFDMLGRSVRMLVNEERPAGTYNVRLNGDDLSSGVYLYRLTAADQTITRKMLLLK